MVFIKGTARDNRDWSLEINLYELANKCKEYFSLNTSNCIMSFLDFDGTWFANVSGTIFEKGFQGTSEPEVIFKACEYILKKQD
jgi:hypothetical protein